MVRQLTILGAWCLLAAALSDPAWAITHAVLHHEHGAHPAGSAPLVVSQVVESGEHDHRHADRFLALQSRSMETGSKLAACTGAFAIALPTATRILTRSEGPPSRANPDPMSRSAPRAPPAPLA